MVNRFAVWRSLAVMASASIFSTMTWAAGADVSGFGGGVYVFGGDGTHAIFGAAAGYEPGDNTHLFGEFNHSGIASTSLLRYSESESMSSFGGGVDYSFGPSGSKLPPYAVVAVGVGHFYTSGLISTATNAFYASVGGGARLYVKGNWGLKPEVRFTGYVGTASLVQCTVGLFYQFGK